MSADNGTVNHALLHIWVVGKVCQHSFPNALVTPPGKTLVNGIPSPVFGWQEPPRRTTTGQPQDAFDEAATFGFVLTDIGIRVATQEIPYLCPLAILESHCRHETILSFLLKCQHTLTMLDYPHQNLSYSVA